MASQKDVQDLLRMLTTGRNKVPMMAAMARIKALQSAGLKTIASIAEADVSAIQAAISDEKAAKQLQTAAKSAVKDPSKKRSATDDASSENKRRKSAYELSSEPQTPQALEASLELPAPSTDEEEISQTRIITNRAPLVLAFAVSLLKYTMPEQPLSSRLSLAQAVVSVNSRSKAVSLGIEKGASAEEDGWGQGQPKVRILGREIHVLKRGGYEWRSEEKGDAKDEKVEAAKPEEEDPESSTSNAQDGSNPGEQAYTPHSASWSTSQSVTLKKSTFIARSIAVSTPSQARALIHSLLESTPALQTADHNITAWRVPSSSSSSHHVIEESNDDGETGGGRHVLQLLRDTNLVGVLVVVTRWYGGIMLGPDRWRLINDVVRDTLSQRLRITGSIGGEALWGLDLEAMRSGNAPVTGGTAGGMPVYKPEGARAYILKAFASAPSDLEDGSGGGKTSAKKKQTGVALEREKEHNLGLLLGALDMLFGSWVEHISQEELDRRAWSWYVQVRPEVEGGVAGWGAKGVLKLRDLLELRRKG